MVASLSRHRTIPRGLRSLFSEVPSGWFREKVERFMWTSVRGLSGTLAAKLTDDDKNVTTTRSLERQLILYECLPRRRDVDLILLPPSDKTMASSNLRYCFQYSIFSSGSAIKLNKYFETRSPRNQRHLRRFRLAVEPQVRH